MDFRGKLCFIGMIWVAVMCGDGQFQINNSAWGWDSGLQREGLLSKNDMGCCVVLVWAGLCLVAVVLLLLLLL